MQGAAFPAPSPRCPAHVSPSDCKELRPPQRQEAAVSRGPAVQGLVISWERRPPGGLVELRESSRSPSTVGTVRLQPRPEPSFAQGGRGHPTLYDSQPREALMLPPPGGAL